MMNLQESDMADTREVTQHAHALVAANFLAQLDDSECRAWIATLLALRSLSKRRNERANATTAAGRSA